MVAVEYASTVETEKEVAPLGVAGGAEGNGADSTSRHGIVVLLMGLYVGAKFELAMFCVVNRHTSDNGTRAEGVGDTLKMRKTVEPKIAGTDHFDDHSGRHFRERKSIVDASSAFLDGANIALDVRDVLVG